MVIVERKMLVKQEHSDQFTGVFTAECPMAKIEGFIRRSVFRKKLDNGQEEFIIYAMFEDETALKRWSDSDAPKQEREHRKELFAFLMEESVQRVQLVKELFPE
jgi:heme-degrading monooxygenase HmoA